MTQSQLDIVSPLYGPSSMTMSLSTDRSTFAPSAAPSSAAVSNEHALYLLAAPPGSGVDQASSRGILFTGAHPCAFHFGRSPDGSCPKAIPTGRAVQEFRGRCGNGRFAEVKLARQRRTWMAKPMTKAKVADYLAGKLDVSKKQANTFLE